MRALAAIAFLAAAFPAAAQDHYAEITPIAGYRFGGAFPVDGSAGEYDVDDSSAFGMIVNFPHRSNTEWEVIYTQQRTDARFSDVTVNDPVVDLRTHVLQLGGTYIGDGGRVRPYLAATIGGTHIRAASSGSASDTFFSGSIGLGVKIRPSARLGLRLEARAWGTFMRSSSDLLCDTGPDAALCAARIEGDVLSQIETFAGVVLRF